MIDFRGIDLVSFIGQPIGKPAALCNGTTAQVTIQWLLYEVGNALPDLGIQVDLSGIAPALQLDQIRSVYIDNLESAVPIYVYFPDTGFTACCLPYSVAWVPVITNNRRATIYGIGFTDTSIPLTNVFFNSFNMPMANQTISASSSITPVSITLASTIFGTTVGATQTFNAASIGDAGTGRKLLIGAVYNASNGANTTIAASSITVNGNAATLLSNVASGFSANATTALYALDAGTTANIVVNLNAAAQSCKLFIWNMYNNISNTPYTSQATIAAAQSVSQNIEMRARSSMISLGVGNRMVDSGAAVCAFSSMTGVIVDDSQVMSAVPFSASACGGGHYNSPVLVSPYNTAIAFSNSGSAGIDKSKIITHAWEP